ncbi:hypothetical protein PF010_g7029 [Phytophthora fragariae]|uniref:RxLR effector protein n=1 Tax=Phytophthora fragariae TaxID=53985 RepID=A0A6A4EXF4_9STRA|nr:hypothetical protein PF003_g16719 [Phytophthora fragariae]KAE9121609.1 hypothetical protein PF010_g7029 [Phytophthora fragariae]KAE9324896.1 hypothetical protein PF001_g3193 [Phytophthora fragariae]
MVTLTLSILSASVMSIACVGRCLIPPEDTGDTGFDGGTTSQ